MINTAAKGAKLENSLLRIALSKGATLGIRGASSKSRAKDKNLKIDIMLIKGSTLYLIQAKNHAKKASPGEIIKFHKSIENNGLDHKMLYTEAYFIESEEQMKELFEIEE